MLPSNSNHFTVYHGTKDKNDHHGMRKTNNNFEVNHPFIKEILEVLMRIGHLTHHNAIELINNSWVASQIKKQDSIIRHESSEYWCFLFCMKLKNCGIKTIRHI